MSEYMKDLKKQDKKNEIEKMKDELCEHLTERVRAMESVEVMRYYDRLLHRDYLIFG